MHAETSTSTFTPHFQLGSGLWNNLSETYLDVAVVAQRERARAVLNDRGVAVPIESLLELVAMAAAEATILLFHAATDEPSPEHLDRFFEQFVLAATQGSGREATI
jgi:hypothetical protein